MVFDSQQFLSSFDEKYDLETSQERLASAPWFQLHFALSTPERCKKNLK